MSEEKKVTLKMDIRTAAAVRQILFDAQEGYTYDKVSVPPRVSYIRGVILNIDAELETKINKQ